MTDTKDTSVIPQGDYCYTWIEAPSEINNLKGKIKACPYLTKKTFNGVDVPWCNFLNCGGLDNNQDDSDIPKLIEHFGSEEKMNEELPLFLLWDMVKECGINEPKE
jgi:hypothetical protein